MGVVLGRAVIKKKEKDLPSDMDIYIYIYIRTLLEVHM